MRNFKTYYLVEPVHSSLQETGFKVKNTFDKIYYFTFNLGFTQTEIIPSLLWTVKIDYDEPETHF